MVQRAVPVGDAGSAGSRQCGRIRRSGVAGGTGRAIREALLRDAPGGADGPALSRLLGGSLRGSREPAHREDPVHAGGDERAHQSRPLPGDRGDVARDGYRAATWDDALSGLHVGQSDSGWSDRRGETDATGEVTWRSATCRVAPGGPDRGVGRERGAGNGVEKRRTFVESAGVVFGGTGGVD